MPLFEHNILTEEELSAPTDNLAPVETSAPRVAGEPDTMDNSTRGVMSNVGRKKTDHDETLSRVKTRQLCVVTRQLATLMRAGMPAVPALAALVEQLEGEALGEVFSRIRDHVNSGDTLAAALQRYPSIFSSLYINMVRAGEASGTLEDVLLSLAHMLEKRAQLNARVKSALAYPALMTVLAVAVVVFLMAFVIPSLTKIFLDMKQELPWPTTVLIAVSNFSRDYLAILLTVTTATAFAAIAWLKTPKGKWLWDRTKLRVPLLGDLLLKLEASRLTRTLGIMLGAGISILEALTIVKGVVQNSFIAARMDEIKEAVGRGDTIAHAIKNTGLFAPIMYHTIAVGEMSGNVEEQLAHVADAYDEEVDLSLRTLVALLEPLILLAMALIVGFIVMAILLPIFDINQMI
jgi:general secretion pathway protein F